MSNLRIISDNAADRATLTSSSTTTANLKLNTRSKVCRAKAFDLAIRASWPMPETVRAVAVPFTNLSPTATIRVRASNESTVTNYLMSSERLVDSSWNKEQVAIGYSVATAPDGSTPVFTMVETAVNLNHDVYQTVTLGGATYYTFSVFVRAAGRNYVQLQYNASGASVKFNLATGLAVGTTGANYFSSSITPVAGTSWFRVSLTHTTPVGAPAAANYIIYVGNATGVLTYLGDGVSGIDIWGAMVENSSFMSSYYPSANVFLARPFGGASFINSLGLVEFTGVNVPRMQYRYPELTSLPARLLVEQAATNLLIQSKTFSGWDINGGTRADNYGIAPDGVQTSTKVSGGTFYKTYAAPSLAVYTYSLFVKNKSDTGVVILRDGTVTRLAIFNFATETFSSISGSDILSTGFQKLPNGWYRVWITFNNPAGNGNYHLYPVSGEVEFWGAQLETGTISSYIETTTVAVTRQGDSYSGNTGTRPVGYIDHWQSYSYDSGAVDANTVAINSTVRGWTAAQSASAYSYGGGSYARHWLPTAMAVTGVSVDIQDKNNLQGYVEVSRLVIGDYWEPAGVGAEIGATMTMDDTSKQIRTEAGELITDTGIRFRKQELSLPDLNPTDRAKMWSILWANGLTLPVFISTYPGSSDAKLEQAHHIFGKLVKTPVMGTPYFNRQSATIEIEEV